METAGESTTPTSKIDFSNYEPVVKSKDIDMTKISIEAFRQMKTQFPNETDTKIAQFLLARNCDVTKASELLASNVKWRAETFPLRKEMFANEMSKGKAYFIGYDKEGHPVIMYVTRQHNPRERDPAELSKMFFFWAEYLISKLPEDRTKVTLLINRLDSGFNNFDQDFMGKFAKVGQDNYPELLHKAVVYPSNIMFQTVWAIARLFLDPVTQAKVNLCMFQSGVFEHIDPKYIPVEMGGTSTYVYNPDDFNLES